MSLTRTPRLAVSDTNNTSTISGSVTAATGSWIIVIASAGSSRTVSGVTWGAESFFSDLSTLNGTTDLEILSARAVAGGTNTLTVTFSGSSTNKILIVVEIGSTNGTFGAGTTATGSGTTNPAITSTSPTGTPNAYGQTIWFGAIVVQRNNTDAAPSWSVPGSAGQKAGTTTTYLAEGFEIDASAKTQALSATMATAAGYTSALINYSDAAGISVEWISPIQGPMFEGTGKTVAYQ